MFGSKSKDDGIHSSYDDFDNTSFSEENLHVVQLQSIQKRNFANTARSDDTNLVTKLPQSFAPFMSTNSIEIRRANMNRINSLKSNSMKK